MTALVPVTVIAVIVERNYPVAVGGLCVFIKKKIVVLGLVRGGGREVINTHTLETLSLSRAAMHN